MVPLACLSSTGIDSRPGLFGAIGSFVFSSGGGDLRVGQPDYRAAGVAGGGGHSGGADRRSDSAASGFVHRFASQRPAGTHPMVAAPSRRHCRTRHHNWQHSGRRGDDHLPVVRAGLPFRQAENSEAGGGDISAGGCQSYAAGRCRRDRRGAVCGGRR